MTLLICALAAVAVTAIWYRSPRARLLRVGVLCYLYGGASLMWLVDAAAAGLSEGAFALCAAPAALFDDAVLGLSAVVLGLVIWACALFVLGPEVAARAVPTSEGRRAS